MFNPETINITQTTPIIFCFNHHTTYAAKKNPLNSWGDKK